MTRTSLNLSSTFELRIGSKTIQTTPRAPCFQR